MNELNIEEVKDYLQKNKLPLFASQDGVSFPILNRIHRRLKEGRRFSAIHVDNDLIVNGHHRYVCLCILGLEIEHSAWMRNANSNAICWSKIVVDEEDWDSDRQREIYRQRYDSKEITL